jgi:hypothetical protein
VLRVFRPDLIADEMRRFVEACFGAGFTSTSAASAGEIMRSATEHDCNLLLVARGQDPRQELMRMHSLLRIEAPLKCITLTLTNIRQLPSLLREAA